jgi:hypothetical protein
MKVICHRTTKPTAELLAAELGADLMELDGPIGNLLTAARSNTEGFVNWGYRIQSPPSSLDQMRRMSGIGITNLNFGATLKKPDALLMMHEAGVAVPRFLSGQLLIRPPMTRRGRMISECEGVAMERIDKDLEFRVDVFCGKAFRLHVKQGPADVVAWNRDYSEWTTYGSSSMLRQPGTAFPGANESQMRDTIFLAKKAVAALKYDFGAVDIIRERGTNRLLVLEVNAAPSLCESGIKKYANRIRKAFGLPTVASTSEYETH